MISWYKMIPVAKIMYDTLIAVIKAQTDKSSPGQITREEVLTILMGQVDNVCSTLTGILINEK
jgi:hypothetical protein